MSLLGIFLLENPIEKTMDYSNALKQIFIDFLGFFLKLSSLFIRDFNGN
jgi:hypothetical protein